MVPKWSVTQGVSPRRYACLSNIRVERIRGILQPCGYTHMAGFMFQLPFKPLTGDEVRASSSYWAQGLSSLWYHRSLLIKYRAGGWKNQWRLLDVTQHPASSCSSDPIFVQKDGVVGAQIHGYHHYLLSMQCTITESTSTLRRASLLCL